MGRSQINGSKEGEVLKKSSPNVDGKSTLATSISDSVDNPTNDLDRSSNKHGVAESYVERSEDFIDSVKPPEKVLRKRNVLSQSEIKVESDPAIESPSKISHNSAYHLGTLNDMQRDAMVASNAKDRAMSKFLDNVVSSVYSESGYSRSSVGELGGKGMQKGEQGAVGVVQADSADRTSNPSMLSQGPTVSGSLVGGDSSILQPPPENVVTVVVDVHDPSSGSQSDAPMDSTVVPTPMDSTVVPTPAASTIVPTLALPASGAVYPVNNRGASRVVVSDEIVSEDAPDLDLAKEVKRLTRDLGNLTAGARIDAFYNMGLSPRIREAYINSLPPEEDRHPYLQAFPPIVPHAPNRVAAFTQSQRPLVSRRGNGPIVSRTLSSSAPAAATVDNDRALSPSVAQEESGFSPTVRDNPTERGEVNDAAPDYLPTESLSQILHDANNSTWTVFKNKAGAFFSAGFSLIAKGLTAIKWNTLGAFRRELSRYDFVYMTIEDRLTYRNGECRFVDPSTIKKDITLNQSKDGSSNAHAAFSAPGHQHMPINLPLVLVKDVAGNTVSNAGRKLYEVKGYAENILRDKKKSEKRNYVVWVNDDNQLSADGYSVKYKFDGRVSNVYYNWVAQGTQTVNFLASVVTFPFIVAASFIKYTFVLAGTISRCLGTLLCASADKIIGDSASKLDMHNEGSLTMESAEVVGATVRRVLGGVLGLLGSSFKVVGTMISSVGHLASAIVKSAQLIPVVLLRPEGWVHRAKLCASHLFAAAKDLPESIGNEIKDFGIYLGVSKSDLSAQVNNGYVGERMSEKVLESKALKGTMPTSAAELAMAGAALSTSRVQYVPVNSDGENLTPWATRSNIHNASALRER